MKSELKNIAIDKLQRGHYQPRRVFEQNALQELAASIKAQGIIEPIIVRPISAGFYEIIAGERRWRAAQLAALEQVPCIVRDYSDKKAAEVTLIENIQRENLNPLEEAQALYQLVEEFNYSHESLAIALGKSRAKITNSLRLLTLDQRVQQLIADKQLSEGHGRALAGLAFRKQFPLAEICISQNWSVRKLEHTLKQQRNAQSTVHKKNSDADIKVLERRLTDYLNTEVSIHNNPTTRHGWLKIRYYDYDTLSGILQKIGIDED